MSLLTQLLLVISQIVILPAQLSVWGEVATAGWYASLAVAMLATVADLGFRVRGHDDLITIRDHPSDVAARDRFSTTWGMIRLLVVATTLAILAIDILIHAYFAVSYSVWRIGLITALGLETLVVVRVMYLDTFRLYVRAELGYLMLITLRVAAGLTALLILGWGEAGLAGIYLLSSIIGLLFQERLCRPISALALHSKIKIKPTWTDWSAAAKTMSDPLANWVRLSLPVLVLGQLAPPRAITAYVVLRAIFSAVRSVLQQVARVASTEVLVIGRHSSPAVAVEMLTIFLAASTFIATASGVAVVLDRLRLVSYWVSGLDGDFYLPLAAAFAVTAAFFPYQILLAIIMRQGDIWKIARIQYAYVGSSALGSALIVGFGATQLYPVVLALSEIGLAAGFYLTFNLAQDDRPSRAGLYVSGVSAAIVLAVVAYVSWGAGPSSDRLLLMDATAATLAVGLLMALAAWTVRRAWRTVKQASPVTCR